MITHVTITDTHNGQLQPDMTVVISRDRISKIEKSKPENWRDAVLLDGRGKFLIPGLWDMQVHLSWTTASALPLLVANGITDVRDMGGRLEELNDWRTKIANGLLVGPGIVRVGPMLNGKSFNRYQMAIGTPEETRGVARALKFIGVDGIEIERRVDRDSYFALIDEAKRQGLPVGGHVPIGVKPEEASDAGQRTIEHIETLFEGTFSAGLKDNQLPEAIDRFLSSHAADALFAHFVANHTAYTPDLAMYQWSINALDRSAPPDPCLRYVALSARNEFKGQYLPADDLNTMRQTYLKLVDVVGQMNRDGVLLLAGTDIAGPRIPGVSLHDELSALVKAGLTPLQALQTATLNPAIVLDRTADFGSVEANKMADLVLLDANPLESIDNTKRIYAVVLKGRLFRRRDLDLLLKQVEDLASKS